MVGRSSIDSCSYKYNHSSLTRVLPASFQIFVLLCFGILLNKKKSFSVLKPIHTCLMWQHCRLYTEYAETLCQEPFNCRRIHSESPPVNATMRTCTFGVSLRVFQFSPFYCRVEAPNRYRGRCIDSHSEDHQRCWRRRQTTKTKTLHFLLLLIQRIDQIAAAATMKQVGRHLRPTTHVVGIKLLAKTVYS